MTGQDVYQIYHRECLKVKTGRIPRNVVDFSNYEKKDNKQFFERVAEMKGMAGELLNVDLFIQALAIQHGGFFNPKLMIAPSAMKVYRIYLSELNAKKDPDDINQRIINDIKFVSKFCAEKNLNCLEDYLEDEKCLIPSIIKHAYSGQISYFFLACIEFFPHLLQNYPADARELISDFDYKLCRSKVIFSSKGKVIVDNFYNLIRMMIGKYKENRNEQI